jgi:hypothetical protein
MEKNPFLEDYRENVIQGVIDMVYVSQDVIDFLYRRYGDEIKTANYTLFLCVFVLGFLEHVKMPLEHFIKTLEAIYSLYQEAKKLALSRQP